MSAGESLSNTLRLIDMLHEAKARRYFNGTAHFDRYFIGLALTPAIQTLRKLEVRAEVKSTWPA